MKENEGKIQPRKRKRKRKSRRIQQRWKRKRILNASLFPSLDKAERRPNQIAHYMTIENDKNLQRTFGFIANPSYSKWENATNILRNTPISKYYNKTNNLAYHNLCTRLTPPNGIGSLLGLGLKFCIKTMRPDKFPVYSMRSNAQRRET